MLVRVVHLCSKFVDGCKSTPISPPSSLARTPACTQRMAHACQHSRTHMRTCMYPQSSLGFNTTLIYTLRTSDVHMYMNVYRSHCFENMYLYYTYMYMCTCSDAHAECMNMYLNLQSHLDLSASCILMHVVCPADFLINGMFYSDTYIVESSQPLTVTCGLDAVSISWTSNVTGPIPSGVHSFQGVNVTNNGTDLVFDTFIPELSDVYTCSDGGSLTASILLTTSKCVILTHHTVIKKKN